MDTALIVTQAILSPVYLFVIGDFFRRRRPRRQRDDWPAEPLLHMLVFWVLFGLGALVGAVAIVAAIAGRTLIGVSMFAVACLALVAAIVLWMRLNRS